MGGQQHARAGRLALTLAAAGATSAALASSAPAAAGDEQAASGAPKKAVVKFDAAQAEVPPPAFALTCFTMPNCSTSGTAALRTQAEVPVESPARDAAASGAAPLEYASAEGYVARSIACPNDPPAISDREVADGIDGELAVSDLRSGPGANTLAVTLDTGGRSGDELPTELVEAGEGGCGVPEEDHDIPMTIWHANFTGAHQDEWQQDGGFRIDDLAWDSGADAFTKLYARPASVGFGPLAYTYRERTQLEVRPEYCEGPLNRVSTATANGESIGADGMRIFPGQVVDAPAGSKIRFSDGAVAEFPNGGSYEVAECADNLVEWTVSGSIRKAWIEVKKALSGSKAKFNVKTDRAVAGVRGTKYQLSYDKPKQLTRVAVKEGIVSLKGINGAKGQILIKAGQVGIQKGKKKPKLIKR